MQDLGYDIFQQFQMSVITANPSVISGESRPRGSSKHLRNYQRVSDANLDEKAIVSYLRSHNLHRTLATFVSESHYSQNVEPILQIIEAGASSWQASLEELIELIKSQCGSKENRPDLKNWVMVEFYLHIWYCLGTQQLDKTKIGELKEYINLKGDAISQFPELLPYFALPYAQSPTTHPFLKRIFTTEWKEGLKGLISDIIGRRQEYKDEEQWLNIIQDMIEISKELYSHLPTQDRTPILENMMERVRLYRYVIDKNKASKSEQKNKQLHHVNVNISTLDYSNVEGLQALIAELQRQMMQNKKLGASLELSVVYHNVQLQLIALEKFKQDKHYLRKLIQHDVCCLHNRQSRKLEQQQLKLLQMMSSYYEGRTYLESNVGLVKEIRELLQEHSKEVNMKETSIQVITVAMDILRKMAIRPAFFHRIIEERGMVDLVLCIFQTVRTFYLKGGKSLYAAALTSTAHLLTQLAIHRKGRILLARTSYFDFVSDFFKQIKTRELPETLEKVLCSAIYLLLVEPEIRLKAERLKVKDILLDRMLQKQNEGYQTIVSYIIQRIEMEDDIQDGNSDEDQEKSIQFDENVRVDAQAIVHRGQIIKIIDLDSFRAQKSSDGREPAHPKGSGDERVIGNPKQGSSKERERVSGNGNRGPSKEAARKYQRQKYERKGSKSSYIRDVAELRALKF